MENYKCYNREILKGFTIVSDNNRIRLTWMNKQNSLSRTVLYGLNTSQCNKGIQQSSLHDLNSGKKTQSEAIRIIPGLQMY